MYQRGIPFIYLLISKSSYNERGKMCSFLGDNINKMLTTVLSYSIILNCLIV